MLRSFGLVDQFRTLAAFVCAATSARGTWRARLRTLLAILGPGLIVMVGDNDAGAFGTYTQAGQNYGTTLLWTLLLLIPVLYVNQEMVLRLGAVTRVGHARLIFARFGKFWGSFSVIDLFLVNALTLVTEFIGISLALEYLGIPRRWGVCAAAALVMLAASTGDFRRFERFALLLVAGSLTLIPLFVMVHPPMGQVARDFFVPALPAGAPLAEVMLLIIAIVGTTVAPWQLFFQQAVCGYHADPARELPARQDERLRQLPPCAGHDPAEPQRQDSGHAVYRLAGFRRVREDAVLARLPVRAQVRRHLDGAPEHALHAPEAGRSHDLWRRPRPKRPDAAHDVALRGHRAAELRAARHRYAGAGEVRHGARPAHLPGRRRLPAPDHEGPGDVRADLVARCVQPGVCAVRLVDLQRPGRLAAGHPPEADAARRVRAGPDQAVRPLGLHARGSPRLERHAHRRPSRRHPHHTTTPTPNSAAPHSRSVRLALRTGRAAPR
ncbi:Divalent metal cation transporter MntH [Ralstonia mannitolilytica]|nr:Divalent metal cation transporter MntH [Ralstonia mannitolilytica]